jgi:hypothetical protein
MSEEKGNNTGEPEKSRDHDGQAGEPPYPPLLDYLQSKEGHELASRIVAILEDVKKATIESATETHKRNMGPQRLWLVLQSGVFAVTILIAALLAWHVKVGLHSFRPKGNPVWIFPRKTNAVKRTATSPILCREPFSCRAIERVAVSPV